ncbi:MAG: helix-turn-helix domain-containing protein [Nostocaceae cyanobacterium]|nr:helix-turn-helix domain-containing protein [Nostocaceae cyanobacterium]
MFVGTTEAATRLGICAQRVRQLLQAGRIVGAVKVGRFWQIPLRKGMPVITKIKIKRNKAENKNKSKWRHRLTEKHKIIHIKQQNLKHNRDYKTNLPVIIVRQGDRVKYCHEVDIKGPSRLVYQRLNPLPECGAVLWIDVAPNVPVITKLYSQQVTVLGAS